MKSPNVDFKTKRLARGIAYCISPATSLEEIA